MLSRVADSLYWMSRYVERAENVTRFIDVNNLLSLDLPAGYVEQWAPLISTTGDDVSQRRLALLPSRPHDRKGRQNLADTGCEILSPAAVRRCRRKSIR